LFCSIGFPPVSGGNIISNYIVLIGDLQMSRKALVIGIDDYPSDPLHGCIKLRPTHKEYKLDDDMIL
jgi:hypothetical protein